MGQYCFASSVVYNAAGVWASWPPGACERCMGTLPVVGPASRRSMDDWRYGGRPCGRSGGWHCTAGASTVTSVKATPCSDGYCKSYRMKCCCFLVVEFKLAALNVVRCQSACSLHSSKQQLGYSSPICEYWYWILSSSLLLLLPNIWNEVPIASKACVTVATFNRWLDC